MNMSKAIDLFAKLGGTREMAKLLGEPPSTVQSWKSAGRIPSQKQPLVIQRARDAGISVTADDVVWPLEKRPAAKRSQAMA